MEARPMTPDLAEEADEEMTMETNSEAQLLEPDQPDQDRESLSFKNPKDVLKYFELHYEKVESIFSKLTFDSSFYSLLRKTCPVTISASIGDSKFPRSCLPIPIWITSVRSPTSTRMRSRLISCGLWKPSSAPAKRPKPFSKRWRTRMIPAQHAGSCSS